MTRFGFLTDTHFSVVRSDFRTDSYFDSVLSKMRQCYEYFASSGCSFIVHGGDVFDRYRSCSYQMIVAIREIIMESPVPTYFIWGQHDLLGYSSQSSSGSNLAFLKEICDGRLIEVGESAKIGDIAVHASHVYDDPLARLRGIPAGDVPSVCIVHALLYNGRSMFDCIDVNTIGKISPVLVLSGDLHSGFDSVEANGTTYYNPGSLARTCREKRRPRCCSVEIGKGESGWDVSIEDFYPECVEYPFPKETAPEARKIEQDSPEYIEAFEKFRSESKDIFERLDKVGKAHRISDEVLSYIKSKQK